MNCLAVMVKDVMRSVSPTAHVFVRRGSSMDVTFQALFVRTASDVSVAVTADHGAHDAVSVTVTFWPTEREIDGLLDVTVHFATIINESVGAVPICVGVNLMAVLVLSTTVPMTVMSKKDALAELQVVKAGPNVVDARE